MTGRPGGIAIGTALLLSVAAAAAAAALDGGGYRYDAAGKRDPFRPLALRQERNAEQRAPLTPLQRYEIGQLKLVGVIRDVTPPRALVEDSAGLGFILTPGTPIGPHGGVVATIGRREVVVEEWQTDVIGERHRREIVLELPKDEAEPAP